jgi:hypothetical protein
LVSAIGYKPCLDLIESKSPLARYLFTKNICDLRMVAITGISCFLRGTNATSSRNSCLSSFFIASSAYFCSHSDLNTLVTAAYLLGSVTVFLVLELPLPLLRRWSTLATLPLRSSSLLQGSLLGSFPGSLLLPRARYQLQLVVNLLSSLVVLRAITLLLLPLVLWRLWFLLWFCY